MNETDIKNYSVKGKFRPLITSVIILIQLLAIYGVYYGIKNQGFNLVIESIEQEKSWDRIQKVFASIGMNKPEFFSELFNHRFKNNNR